MGIHKNTRQARRGFTMVETLVAMAILITVITGVVLVYSGAVRTVRQTYRAQDNFEIGRSVLAALQRDLERSFTAREYGKYYQFHGSPQSMMFVGVLEDGQLGRVTYAINRLDNKNDFIMRDTQSLRTVLERAMAQVSDESVGDDVTRLNIAKQFTRRLAILLAQDGSVVAGDISQETIIDSLPLALDNAFVTAPTPFDLNPLTVEYPAGSGNILDYSDATLDFEVRVETAYMLRYEEPDVTDLSSYNMPPDPALPTAKLSFPVIDASSADGVKNFPTIADFENSCRGLLDRTVEQRSIGQEMLACLTYSSIVAPRIGGGVLDDLDLRRLMNNQSTYNVSASYITGITVDRIYEAAKREIWLNLFTGGDLARAIFSGSTLANTPENYFEAWQLDADPANNLNPYDYAIAERIVTGGRIVTYQDLANDPFYLLLQRFDVLGVNAYFTYADEDNKYRETYNTLEDIPGYPVFADPFATDPNTGAPFEPDERFRLLDAELGNEMAGNLTLQGSPMAPRIPALVSPRFWIMSEGASANDPPFKRYFDQVVDVPTGARRNLPKQFVPDAG